MKCNKCSTPIIPGETRCRFCGSTVVNNKKEEEPEIIEIIDDNNDSVTEIVEIIEEPEIIDIVNTVEETKDNFDITDELDKTSKLEKIDIEEFTGKLSKEELNEIEEKVEEIEKKDKKNKKSNEENNDNNNKEEKNLNNKTKKQFNESSNLYIIIIVISILLIISLIFNLFLFLNRNITKKEENKTISNVKTNTYFNNYEFSIPNNWYTKTETEKNTLMIFDDSDEWGASLQILKDVDFTLITKKADKIQEEYAKKGYVFTSNYTKNIDNVDYFLYKGKFETYSVYLIIRKIDDKNVLVTDLQFKGEIEKDVLDTILDSFLNISYNNLSKLYENNFTFEPNGEIIYNIAKKNIEISK